MSILGGTDYTAPRSPRDPRSHASSIQARSEIRSDFNVEPSNIADAFYQKAYLVELVYPAGKFVVAISNAEATSPNEAFEIARNRASDREVIDVAGRSNKFETDKLEPLDYLFSYRVLRDCAQSRELLAVAGPQDPQRISTLPWYDADPVPADQE